MPNIQIQGRHTHVPYIRTYVSYSVYIYSVYSDTETTHTRYGMHKVRHAHMYSMRDTHTHHLPHSEYSKRLLTHRRDADDKRLVHSA